MSLKMKKNKRSSPAQETRILIIRMHQRDLTLEAVIAMTMTARKEAAVESQAQTVSQMPKMITKRLWKKNPQPKRTNYSLK